MGRPWRASGRHQCGGTTGADDHHAGLLRSSAVSGRNRGRDCKGKGRYSETSGTLHRRRQQDDAAEVIEARAARLGVPLIAEGQHWHVTEERGRTVYQDDRGLLDLPAPSLIKEEK